MKILVPFDFSKSSGDGLAIYIWHYKMFGAVLMCYMHMPSAASLPHLNAHDLARRDGSNGAKERLEQIITAKKQTLNLPDEAIQCQVLLVHRPHPFCSKKKADHYDLIVMGTHDKESLFDLHPGFSIQYGSGNCLFVRY